MTSCFEFELLISQKLDGELSEAEEALLTLHLQTCVNCRTLYEDLINLQETLSSFSVSPPSYLHTQIIARIKDETAVKRPALSTPIRKFFPSKWLGAAVALLLLVSGTVLGIQMITDPDIAALDQGGTYSLSDPSKGNILTSECESKPEADTPKSSTAAGIERKPEQNPSVRRDTTQKGFTKESAPSASEEKLDSQSPPPSDMPTEPESTYGAPPPSLDEDTPDEETLNTRAASLFPEGLAFDEAEALLLQYLTKEESPIPPIVYQGLSSDGTYHLFLCTDDNGINWTYSVSRMDGTILVNPPQEHLSVDN